MRMHSFEEFWPYYLAQHKKSMTRLMHFIGTGTALIAILLALLTFNAWYLLLAVVMGYGFAWYGHLFIEQNRPATWRFPRYSLQADLLLFWIMLTRGFAFEDFSLPRNPLKGK
ncbi:DUF962 domain-containing protein [Sulfobacillus thermosulfidooxidans]|uniref:DUF962 domain-containing protein n=1 Tax=Sulfobacillus thermosulfidooxidans TaxID=28034 RepID=UPI00096B7832|nr:DUF962 domain-containing protein [Sulfobacillus thermosulfidooxidans]OLZ10894.1 hypothetical protein BFX05_09115 [Sulfobacillus thermosulfidooxidans]OLZ14382.1 hypothetical protein BFX06_08940 [Sulfobacillus thermosulfidooxidans]OLZ19125.1 hypothetical protein BFX07_05335 [Sulfobacillus thermosulfidooxidans]